MLPAYFDEQIFIMQRGGGIPRYFAHLMAALRHDAAALDVEPLTRFRFCRSPYLLAEGWARRLPTPLDEPKPLYAFNAPSRAKRLGNSILHHTYYHKRFLKAPKEAVRVTTVHDMIPEALPDYFAVNPHLEKQEFVRRSDLVLCVSHHTKARLLEFYGDIDCPIEVTPLGVDSFWFETAGWAKMRDLETVPDQPFILYVGSRSSYKNFKVVLESMPHLARDGIELVVVGGGSTSTEESLLIEKLGVARHVKFIGADDPFLRHLYGEALAFVYPSLHEGFGLPALEALAAGGRAVLAGASVFPEVGGDAVEYFDPNNPEDLVRVVRAIADESKSERDHHVKKGVLHARASSWDRTAELTARAYHSVAS